MSSDEESEVGKSDDDEDYVFDSSDSSVESVCVGRECGDFAGEGNSDNDAGSDIAKEDDVADVEHVGSNNGSGGKEGLSVHCGRYEISSCSYCLSRMRDSYCWVPPPDGQILLYKSTTSTKPVKVWVCQ